MNTAELILYSTWGCHLCEEAEALLRTQGLQYRVVDIVDDSAAFEQFRTAIPVVASSTTYLCWPFDAHSLGQFIDHICAEGS